jgi:hypothetical protein
MDKKVAVACRGIRLKEPKKGSDKEATKITTLPPDV